MESRQQETILESKNTGRIDGGYGQGNEPDAGSKEDQCACVLRNFEEGEFVDRDKLEPKHFQKWVDFAKKEEWDWTSIQHFSLTKSKRRTDTFKPGRRDKEILD